MNKNNKTNTSKNFIADDAPGFEDFIDGEQDKSFMIKKINVPAKKHDKGFEYFTFLNNDTDRLLKLRLLLDEKIQFTYKYDQTSAIIQKQETELKILVDNIFEISDQKNSPYRKSLAEIFNSYFETEK
jgi:hypothetical protein